MMQGHRLTTRVPVSLFVAALACGGLGSAVQAQGDAAPRAHIKKNGVEVDLRSLGRQVADALAEGGNSVALDEASPVPGETVVPQIQLRGGNVQGNDSTLDNIQVFPGFRPFLEFTQSETSIAASGRSIVVGYNSSANQPLRQLPSGGLVFTRRFLSGFSASGDGGQTWTSGFVPPVPGSLFTFGDPVVAVDRHGTFFYSGLGADASGRSIIQVNRSDDRGRTWSDGAVVQQDNGADKDWMAVGPDPGNKSRDNVYVTWTSFQATGQQLRLGRSSDGGVTWTTQTVFAPTADPNPAHPQNSLQYTNPVVDPVTGRLYIPFARFSNVDQDFLQVLASDDAGETFGLLTFNDLSAPDATLLTVTQPGELIDCRSGGVRLAIHAGTSSSGRFGLRSFVQATRLTVQPTFAARNGVLYLAWSNSTSLVFGDPTSGSNILFVRSEDGGTSWSTPVQVNPTATGDVHHVLPSLALDVDPNDVHITYYTQHADGTVDLDMANSHDRGNTFPSTRNVRVTATGSSLPPTNNRLTATTTTNYDRTIVACYALGEYQGVTTANGSVYTAWGDTRKTVTEPVNVLDPLSGLTHAQIDVFFQKVKAQ